MWDEFWTDFGNSLDRLRKTAKVVLSVVADSYDIEAPEAVS